jgi:hypothetical protein
VNSFDVAAVTEEFARWSAQGLNLSSPVAGSWVIQAYTFNGQLVDSQRLELPAAPTLVPLERLNWDANVFGILQIVSPRGQRFSVRPDQRQR